MDFFNFLWNSAIFQFFQATLFIFHHQSKLINMLYSVLVPGFHKFVFIFCVFELCFHMNFDY